VPRIQRTSISCDGTYAPVVGPVGRLHNICPVPRIERLHPFEVLQHVGQICAQPQALVELVPAPPPLPPAASLPPPAAPGCCAGCCGQRNIRVGRPGARPGGGASCSATRREGTYYRCCVIIPFCSALSVASRARLQRLPCSGRSLGL
jgi:hypothetical protein